MLHDSSKNVSAQLFNLQKKKKNSRSFNTTLDGLILVTDIHFYKERLFERNNKLRFMIYFFKV